MTPKLFRELKAVNFSCTSPDSTSIHHESILITPGIGGRAIDRFSPHLRDPLRSKSFNSPLLPPRSDRNIDNSTTPNSKPKRNKKISEKKTTTVSASPANSQRYLLSSSPNSERFFFNTDEISSSSFTAEKNLPPSKFQYSEEIEESSEVFRAAEKLNDSGFSSSSSSSNGSGRPQEQQVVVLKVSLHCKGCEGKVKKHIAKMEGVTSFTTDLISKKVTVIGYVTPLGVLNSISKVKNAQLWPSQPPPPSSAH